MAKKKKVEESYRLTFKGLLHVVLGNEDTANHLYDEIELHLRRQYSKDGIPAIVLVDNERLDFTTVSVDGE